jgi:hypothetical protein
MKLHKTAAAAALLGSLAAVILAAPAQADGAATFFSCLNENGYTITDVGLATDVGRRIQNDELANVPREQIIWNLAHNYGVGRHQANVYIDCAYWTMGGN